MIVFLIAVVFMATTYLTSVMCCLSHYCRRRASWYLVALGALSTGALTALFYCGGANATPDEFIPFMVFCVATASVLPAFFTVKYFRNRFTGTERISGIRRYIGVAAVMAGTIAMAGGVVLWLKVPRGAVEDNAAAASAAMRAVAWFLGGASFSAAGFYVGQKDINIPLSP
jgi:hypothetical protein